MPRLSRLLRRRETLESFFPLVLHLFVSNPFVVNKNSDPVARELSELVKEVRGFCIPRTIDGKTWRGVVCTTPAIKIRTVQSGGSRGEDHRILVDAAVSAVGNLTLEKLPASGKIEEIGG